MKNRMKAIGVSVAAATVIAASGQIYANAGTSHDGGRDRSLIGKSFLFSADPIPLPGGDPVAGVAFVLQFTDADHMTFTQVAGPTGLGIACENETVHVSSVRPGVFFTRWIEASGISVSHVEDLHRQHAFVSTVIPANLTGASAPVSVSFTGRIARYRGAAQPTCPNNGSGQ